MQERYDRNERFFGKDGQKLLKETHVAVVGVGGLGTHVVQQLSYLGIGSLTLIDNEELDVTNLNRYVGARHDDPIPGTRKVDLGERITKLINPGIHVEKIFSPLCSEHAFSGLTKANYVFGCLDNDGSRFILNEFTSAYGLPYLDIASDIISIGTLTYGGRVAISWDGNGCLYCLDVLDMEDVQKELDKPELRKLRENIYGIDKDLLSGSGPSVVSVNGVIASLGVTEFMVGVTGIREPQKHINYLGHEGKVTKNIDEIQPDCYFCNSIRGIGKKANIERYIATNVTA